MNPSRVDIKKIETRQTYTKHLLHLFSRRLIKAVWCASHGIRIRMSIDSALHMMRLLLLMMGRRRHDACRIHHREESLDEDRRRVWKGWWWLFGPTKPVKPGIGERGLEATTIDGLLDGSKALYYSDSITLSRLLGNTRMIEIEEKKNIKSEDGIPLDR